MSMMERYRKIPLLTKLLVAMVIGIILGAVFGERINVIKPFGTVFLNLLKMAAPDCSEPYFWYFIPGRPEDFRQGRD